MHVFDFMGGRIISQPITSRSERAALMEPKWKVAIETLLAEACLAAADDWLCALCLNPVANQADRFLFEGKDEFAFSNPAGIRFGIRTFSRTLGCHTEG